MNLNKIIASVSIAALVISGYAIVRKPETVVGGTGPQGIQGVKGDKGDVGPRGPQGERGPAGAVTMAAPKLGSVSGPDTYFDYVANNNLQKFGKTLPLTTATTTVCAIKSPAATSTLVFGGVNFIVSSSTASTVTLGKATTPFATTSVLTIGSLAANAQGTIMSTSTPLLATGAINDLVFAPSTYFVVGVAIPGGLGAGYTIAGYAPVGTCSAEFVRI